MPWEGPFDSEINAIHAALVPTANGDGEVVYFGGDEHSVPDSMFRDIDKSRRMNCRSLEVIYVESPFSDLFCSGHAFLADGRLLVGGGTTHFDEAGPEGDADIHAAARHFRAERSCWVYNPFAPGFSEVARFLPDPFSREAEDTGGGHWYPSMVTLSNGQVLAMGGHPAWDDTRHENNTPERYSTATNSWTRLPLVPFVNGYPEARSGSLGYVRLYVMPNDGNVLLVSTTDGTLRYDPWTGDWETITLGPAGIDFRFTPYNGFGSSSVLLPLWPEEDYTARILVVGDEVSQKLDLGVETPAWELAGTRTGSAAGKWRLNCGAVLLPTGKVLVVGGVGRSGNDSEGVLEPEIYDPETEDWQTIEEPANQVRNYHSTYLLMPDGRVWVGGSNIDALRSREGDERRVMNFEVFAPPYPSGARPTLDASPSNVAYGQRFTIECSPASTIERVALLRCGSFTHAFNFDQRHVGLEIVSRNGSTLDLMAPPNGRVAPPGYYMLFVIDGDGRPCNYARFVRVGGEMYVITDRSHFSELEVETMRSPATFHNAFYAVMDGFLESEASLPEGPDIKFEWADARGNVVPGMDYNLERVLFESGSISPGVGQKIVFLYQVRFTDNTAFGMLGAEDQRLVTIIARSGSHEARGTLSLFKSKNPYMVDGRPHWLSVDLRVLSIAAGERFAETPHGSSTSAPSDFLDGVLTVMRDRRDEADDIQPFTRDLTTEQEESPLELAPEVDGRRVYNYAFARVRYRAPVGADAENARVFFRLFTTDAASLEFRPGTYATTDDGSRPLIGLVGGEVATLPFFASSRSTNLAMQDDPQNVRTLSGTGDVTYEYFGCWLDFNQDTPLYREQPTPDGTGGTGDLWSLQQHIRGQHQCLVAELRFDDDPIPYGATPGDNDNLAQRNLAVVESSNPHPGPGHRVQHTFELQPSEVWPPPSQAKATHAVDGHFEASFAAAGEHALSKGRPDQLLVRWNNLPRDSIATFYWPDVNVREIVAMADLRPSASMMWQIDEHTLECRVGDVILLPIPGNRRTNIPGLLSVQLPNHVRSGQSFRISLHQVSGQSGKVLGAFQFTIPVKHGHQLLATETRKLSVLRHIGGSIPPANRWAPVFARYLDEIADRVRAFGGDPDKVAASPKGNGGGRWAMLRCSFLAIMTSILLGSLIAVASLPHTANVSIALAVVALTFLVLLILWRRFCLLSACQITQWFAAGTAAGLGVAGVLVLGGVAGSAATYVMAIGAVVVAGLVGIAIFRCR